ncbi:MAG: hypothetical protein CVU97_05915 [Firmicutes bacterium HGW-Firmicutes-21]|nr:MAG: hypothetical protein CVU97_05915 [Firmicutes bacterium HGW-Firmicutes-21]
MPRPPKRPPNRADGRYEIQRSFKKHTGIDKRKSFYSWESFEDCERQAKEYEAMLIAHRLVGDTLVSREAKFKEWAVQWLEKYKEGKVKASTYSETYERTVYDYLIPHFGEMRIDSILPVDILDFISKQKNKYSASTMKKMRLCLNSIFETAIENDLCRKNPVKRVPFESNIESNKKRTYTQAEVDIIYAFCDTHPSGIYIRILLELGLRCSELCGLKWGDIDYTARSVHIQRATTTVNYRAVTAKPKSKSSNRKLPLSSELLTNLNNNKGEPDEFILSSTKVKGKPLTPLDFSSSRYKTFFKDLNKHLLEEHQKRLQSDNNAVLTTIDELTPHELRHTCGTLLYARTKDIFAVSKYLGHSSIDVTTKLYVHDSADLLRTNLGIK